MSLKRPNTREFGKGGKEIWIQSQPTIRFSTENGNLFKVVKFATDVTAPKLNAANSEGQLDAIR